jgi:hypothetical protein
MMLTLQRTVPVPPNLLVRGARLLAAAIVIGWSLANVIQRVGDWSLSDMDAYWNAAMRLREGGLLYPPVADPAAVDIFKYAPWFAWAWIPLTLLPKAVVGAGWSAILVAASGAALMPLLRTVTLARVAAAALLGSLLIWSAASGNVQPLLVAVLVHGITARAGPIWIGVAASLKVFPLFYALVYVGRREWLRAVVAGGVALLLWLPVFAYDLRHFQGGYADSPSPLLAIHPAAYVVGVVVAITATLVLARTRFAWLAAAAGLFAVLPRVSLIDLTHLLVGTTEQTDRPTDVKES